MTENRTRQYTDDQYNRTAPVVQGSLISYGNKVYILVNRETEENHCYYKSSALACNGMITLNNREVIGIPCYASAMKDGLAEGNNMLSLINGTMELITESNSLSRQIPDFEVEQIINDNQITLCVDDEKVIGSTFVLQAVADSNVMDEMEILVKDEL